MLTAIIYATDSKYLDRTIDGLLDTTTTLDEVIVCDDAGLGYKRQGVTVLSTDKVGRAKAWNGAARRAKGDHLVFLKDKTKFGDDWATPVLKVLAESHDCLVSPVVHTLDLGLWAAEPTRWRRFGWRWDLNLYDRSYTGRPESPAVSSYCIATTKAWFDHLGGFDVEMLPGPGEDIELSLRSWLFGGSVKVCDDATIASALEVDYGAVSNLARIVEAWLPNQASHFYNARGVKPSELSIGRLNNLSRLQSKQRRAVEWFLSSCQPELYGIYELRGAAHGRTVAVVAPGPSLDLINPALVQRHDIVIGVDYVGMMFDCDFVVADSVQVVTELRKKYPEHKFITPLALQDRASASFVPAAELVPLAQQFELGQSGMAPVSLDPPFCNFESLALVAVHAALFLSPLSVTVFGLDNKVLGGRSHTSKLDYYDDGRLWPDTESTRRKFALYEYGLDQLGRLALEAGTPLLRVSHA